MTERIGSLPDAEAREQRLRQFRGPLETNDRHGVEHWRTASPEAHAQAMIELSDYVQAIAAQTGYTKAKDDMFPGFPMETRQ